MKKQRQKKIFTGYATNPADGFTAEQMEKILMAVHNGANIADVLNISKQEREALYTTAYNAYKVQNYKDAERLFKYLSILDSMEPRFTMGYAACLQALGDYQRALEIYGIVCVGGSLNDPSPLYYSALCLMKLDRMDEALNMLEAATIIGETGKYLDIRARASDMLQALKGVQEQK